MTYLFLDKNIYHLSVVFGTPVCFHCMWNRDSISPLPRLYGRATRYLSFVLNFTVFSRKEYIRWLSLNPLMPGGNKKVRYT